MKPTLLLLIMLGATVLIGPSQFAQVPNPGNRGPFKTIKIGNATFSYYQEPETVVAATTFYVSGSKTKSVVVDYVGLTVFFGCPGKQLHEPSVVRFNLVAGTYRDGCKYKDRYADQDNHSLQVNILSDQQTIFSGGLPLPSAHIIDTRNGKLCTELYDFEMPYQQFGRLVQGGKAAIRLGSREFPLKEDHLRALRVMQSGIGQY